MKHRVGDILKVTDGLGNLFNAGIEEISKKEITLTMELLKHAVEQFANITIGIPVLKNNDRMETALEKCVELGFTRFAIFPTVRSTSRKINMERLEKIAVSAMKQSLNLNLPKLTLYNNAEALIQDPHFQIVAFDVRGETTIKDYRFNKNLNYFLFFGPEGGLTPEEVGKAINSNRINLINTRLRTESAIIYTASVIKLLN